MLVTTEISQGHQGRASLMDLWLVKGRKSQAWECTYRRERVRESL